TVVRGRRERLVGDDVHACGDRLQHQLSARLGQRGDGHSVHARGDECGLRVEGRDARVVPGQLGTPLGERVTTPTSSTSSAATMNGAWKNRPPKPYPTR